jgi:hypothetical protein
VATIAALSLPYFSIDVLHYLFPAFVFKVHINIGWLIACRGDENVQTIDRICWVNRSDAKAEAHSGIGSGASPWQRISLLLA